MTSTNDRLPQVSDAVIGGSGLYSLLDPTTSREFEIDTPYGRPSGKITVGHLGDTPIAFLTRHGATHALAPHEINYRANMWALAMLGVRTVVSSSAVGGINPDIPVDTFVVPEQMLDRTVRRESTYSGGGRVVHLSFADPFTPTLVNIAREAMRNLGESVPDFGTIAVIEGPRFSTRAESHALRNAGADIINMTQYPEAALAQELGMGVVNLSFVTDSDAGTSAAEAVDASVVLRRLSDAQPRVIAGITAIVTAIARDYTAPELAPLIEVPRG